MSLPYRIMYRVALTGFTLVFDRGLGRFAGWRLASAQPDRRGELSGPMRNIPRTWYRLVRA